MGSAAPKYEPEAPKVGDADISKFPLQASRSLQVFVGQTGWFPYGFRSWICWISCFKQTTYHLQRNFSDQVVRLEKNPEETNGWRKLKVTLPQTFRMHWLEDVVYSQEWRELLTDFDNKLLGNKLAHGPFTSSVYQPKNLIPYSQFHLFTICYKLYRLCITRTFLFPITLLPGLVSPPGLLKVSPLGLRFLSSPYLQLAHHGKGSQKRFRSSQKPSLKLLKSMIKVLSSALFWDLDSTYLLDWMCENKIQNWTSGSICGGNKTQWTDSWFYTVCGRCEAKGWFRTPMCGRPSLQAVPGA